MSEDRVGVPRPPGSRRIPGQVWDAAAEARRLRGEAAAEARQVVEAARGEAAWLRAEASAAGREEGLARATELIASAALARERLLAGAEGELVEAAVEVARRLVERAAAVDREVVVELAARALEPVRGRADVVLHAHPEDLAALQVAEPQLSRALAGSRALALVAEPALGRGEVRVETEAGAVDARFAPQLEALGRALRGEVGGGW
jgi:flagellar biosynthesis/type III secretory pathway protein FliH